jgi:P-type conjugative transfer protein TrbJ
MKRLIATLIATALVTSVTAGTVAGFGGSTEVTQILNNIQLVNSYAKQVQQFVMQGQQYAAQLKHLEQNPASILPTDVQQLINGIGGMMSAGKSMGATLAQIDQNFANTFKSPVAGNYATQFSTWNKANTDTLQAAMRAAGMQRDQYASDTDALQALYNRSQTTGGDLSALQTLAQINIKQVQQTQALGNLMASQNVAANTFMATQSSQAQSAMDFNNAAQQGFLNKTPGSAVLDTTTKTYQKWNLYPSQK